MLQHQSITMTAELHDIYQSLHNAVVCLIKQQTLKYLGKESLLAYTLHSWVKWLNYANRWEDMLFTFATLPHALEFSRNRIVPYTLVASLRPTERSKIVDGRHFKESILKIGGFLSIVMTKLNILPIFQTISESMKSVTFSIYRIEQIISKVAIDHSSIRLSRLLRYIRDSFKQFPIIEKKCHDDIWFIKYRLPYITGRHYNLSLTSDRSSTDSPLEISQLRRLGLRCDDISTFLCDDGPISKIVKVLNDLIGMKYKVITFREGDTPFSDEDKQLLDEALVYVNQALGIYQSYYRSKLCFPDIQYNQQLVHIHIKRKELGNYMMSFGYNVFSYLSCLYHDNISEPNPDQVNHCQQRIQLARDAIDCKHNILQQLIDIYYDSRRSSHCVDMSWNCKHPMVLQYSWSNHVDGNNIIHLTYSLESIYEQALLCTDTLLFFYTSEMNISLNVSKKAIVTIQHAIDLYKSGNVNDTNKELILTYYWISTLYRSFVYKYNREILWKDFNNDNERLEVIHQHNEYLNYINEFYDTWLTLHEQQLQYTTIYTTTTTDIVSVQDNEIKILQIKKLMTSLQWMMLQLAIELKVVPTSKTTLSGAVNVQPNNGTNTMSSNTETTTESTSNTTSTTHDDSLQDETSAIVTVFDMEKINYLVKLINKQLNSNNNNIDINLIYIQLWIFFIMLSFTHLRRDISTNYLSIMKLFNVHDDDVQRSNVQIPFSETWASKLHVNLPEHCLAIGRTIMNPLETKEVFDKILFQSSTCVLKEVELNLFKQLQELVIESQNKATQLWLNENDEIVKKHLKRVEKTIQVDKNKTVVFDRKNLFSLFGLN